VILAADQQAIKIGRGSDCDLRSGDVSVSRCHAFLKYDSGSFYLEDNESKYGTHVLIKGEYVLKSDFNSEISFGRTVISFYCMERNLVQKDMKEELLISENFKT